MRFTLFAVAVSCLMAVAMAGGASHGSYIGGAPFGYFDDSLWSGYGDLSASGWGSDVWLGDDGYYPYDDGYYPGSIYALGKGVGPYYGGKGFFGVGKGVFGAGKGVYGRGVYGGKGVVSGKAGAAY